MSTFTQANRAAAVGTPLADDHLLLKGMSGYDAISQPFNYTVEMLSEDPNIAFEDLIGENLTIRLNHVEGGDPRYFNGIVADLRQVEPMSGLHCYQALVVPWFWFLKKAGDCRIFQALSVPDILSEVFKLHGFEDFELRLSGSYPELEYCVQYRETDFEFASRLMEEVGIYYFFTHEDGKHIMVLADAKAAHDPCPGFDSIRYIGPTGNSTGPNEIIRWEQRKQVVSGGFALTDYNFAEPKKQLYPKADNEMQHNLAAFEQYQYEGEYTEDGGASPAGTIQFDDLAKVRLQALQAEHAVAYAESDCRGLQAGHTFTLTDCFREDQNAGYFITSIHHQITLDDYLTGGGGSTREYVCTLTAISDSVDYRPARTTRRPRVAGPQTAIVVGRAGEEIDTDEFGRVKVQFHWDRESTADEKSSCWVRVSQNWAGKKWGAFFIPRIGQEVIVDFLEGDPDRPIITGRVYNGDNMPPYDLPGSKTKSTIKSNSSKGGGGFNEIRFEDKKGGEQVFIHAERDMDVRVLNDQREAIMGNLNVRIGEGEKGGTDKSALEELFGEDAGDALEFLDMDEPVGNRSTWIEANDHTLILGDRMEMVEGDHHETTVGDNFQKTDSSQHLTVAKDLNVDAGKGISRKAGKDIQEKAGGNYAMDAGKSIHIKAGQKIILEAGMQISLKVGGNFVDIGPSGVSIKGSMVLVNSGGAAGSGAGSSPTKPDLPEEPPEASKADSAAAGGIASVAGRSIDRNAITLSSNPVPAAQVLMDAHQSGTPFCEQCEKARKEQEGKS